MQIFVKADKTTVFDVEETSTVLELKERMEMDPRVVVLSFAGKALDDSTKFSQTEAKDGSTLYVSLRMRGGRGEEIAFQQEEVFDSFFVTELKPEMGRSTSDWFSLSAPDFLDDLLPEEPAPALESAEMEFVDGDVHQPAAQSAMPAAQDLSQPEADSSTTEEDTDSEPVQVGAKRKLVEEAPVEEIKQAKRRVKARKTSGTQQKQTNAAAPYLPFQMPMAAPQFYNMPVVLQQQQQPTLRKGVAYDLEQCDEKLRKRLLKNRRSAERSRQKKNAALQESSQQLEESRAENAELRGEIEEVRGSNADLERQNEAMRALLLANGIALPF
jgi:hypothetical protein